MDAACQYRLEIRVDASLFFAHVLRWRRACLHAEVSAATREFQLKNKQG